MTKTIILTIIAMTSASLFLGMYAYGIAGNTTVENLGINPDTDFLQIEFSDPDGISLARLCPAGDGTRCFGISFTCDPRITSTIIELPPVALPVTGTVIDCGDANGDGIDETVWKITSNGAVICTEGSCLPAPVDPGPPEETPGQGDPPEDPGPPPGVPPGPP